MLLLHSEMKLKTKKEKRYNEKIKHNSEGRKLKHRKGN